MLGTVPHMHNITSAQMHAIEHDKNLLKRGVAAIFAIESPSVNSRDKDTRAKWLPHPL